MTTGASESLSALSLGHRGRVVGFSLPDDQRQRFQEMGLTVGVEIQVIRFAPLGDPIDIKVRGYHLSLRKNEAAGVLVARL